MKHSEKFIATRLLTAVKILVEMCILFNIRLPTTQTIICKQFSQSLQLFKIFSDETVC